MVLQQAVSRANTDYRRILCHGESSFAFKRNGNRTATEQQQNSNRTSIEYQQNINKTSRGENNMSIKVIFQTARCITFEIQDGSIFESQKEREIYVNGK